MSVEKPNRREVLGGGIASGVVALGALGFMGKYALENMPARERPHLEAYPGRRLELPYDSSIATEFEAPTLYRMGALEGTQATGLTRLYLGHSSKIPEQLALSFPERLYEMWKQKMENQSETSDDTRTLGEALLVEYQTLRNNHAVGSMSFEKFAGTLSDISAEIAYALHDSKGGERERLAALYQLSKYDVQMLLHLTARTDGRVLSAYSMTEVMPNINLYNFILENAGVEFLLRVPAIYDKFTSFGMFQFTRFAHRKGVGSAKANLALPQELQIPDSVERLMTLHDHVGAAILFAINNLAVAISNLRRLHHADDSAISLISNMSRKDFTELVAAFHNRPADGQEALRAWVQARGDQPFHIFCPTSVKPYAKRSGEHYDTVQARLQWRD